MVTVAETVPAGGAAVPITVQLGVVVHVAATGVVAAPATWGADVVRAAAATTLRLPATSAATMPLVVMRRTRPRRGAPLRDRDVASFDSEVDSNTAQTSPSVLTPETTIRRQNPHVATGPLRNADEGDTAEDKAPPVDRQPVLRVVVGRPRNGNMPKEGPGRGRRHVVDVWSLECPDPQ
jgi:hypothetical protein